MKKQALYRSLAVLLQRQHNLHQFGALANPAQHQAYAAVGEELDRLISEHLPSGSGFDAGTRLRQLEAHFLDTRLVFHTSFHHMDEQGGYDGWTEHVVTATAGFNGLTISVSGKNRNDIKAYIGDTFYQALNAEVEAWPDIMLPGVRPVAKPVELPSTPSANLVVELFNAGTIGYHLANPNDQVFLIRSTSGEASLVLDDCEFNARQLFMTCYESCAPHLSCEHVGRLISEAKPAPTEDNSSRESAKALVLKTLEHVRDWYPEVTHVTYDDQGRWFYFDDDHEGPGFHLMIDVCLLEEARDAVENAYGLPAVFCIERQAETADQIQKVPKAPDPSKCPSCGSPHISGGAVEVDGPTTFQRCTCAACDAGWTDVYRLESQTMEND